MKVGDCHKGSTSGHVLGAVGMLLPLACSLLPCFSPCQLHSHSLCSGNVSSGDIFLYMQHVPLWLSSPHKGDTPPPPLLSALDGCVPSPRCLGKLETIMVNCFLQDKITALLKLERTRLGCQ